MDDLQVRVLDDVGRQLGRDLLGNQDALAVGADLGQDVREGLDRLSLRIGEIAARSAADVSEQPVGLFNQGEMTEAWRHLPALARPS